MPTNVNDSINQWLVNSSPAFLFSVERLEFKRF